jgi:hypothetical protein
VANHPTIEGVRAPPDGEHAPVDANEQIAEQRHPAIEWVRGEFGCVRARRVKRHPSLRGSPLHPRRNRRHRNQPYVKREAIAWKQGQ